MSKNKMAIATIIIAIILGAIVFAVISGQNATKRGAIEVTTGKATMKVMEGQYEVLGTLSPEKSATINSKVSGKVNSINIDKGMLVKAGQSLIKIDSTDVLLAQGSGIMANDNIAKYKLSYDIANQQFLNNKSLYENGAISKVAYDQSRVTMEQAQIQYTSAQSALAEQLDKTDIKSPIDGVVVAINVQDGDSVTAGISLVSIVNVDNLVLKGTVPEAVVGLVKLGQDVKIVVDSIYGTEFIGKISFISPISVPAGQIFPIEITIANKDGALMAGMTADAQIKIQTTLPMLVVPASSIVEKDGASYVFIVTDKSVKMTEVRIGVSTEKEVAIVSGIDKNSEIVTENSQMLMDGDLIK
jgi:RND family efflux transporter MFP subunit